MAFLHLAGKMNVAYNQALARRDGEELMSGHREALPARKNSSFGRSPISLDA
jgi:hypothetical protein